MVFVCLDEHEYSDRQRHSSSTDTRSDRSFACQNPDLVAAEGLI